MASDERRKRHRPGVIHPELIGGTEERELAIVPYDPNWPIRFRSEQDRITRTLGDLALMVEHIGSTAVPELAAKPIIDILLTIPDITAEEKYIEPLLAAGYELRVREPGHPNVEAYLLLRKRLRTNKKDRELYAETKRALVAQEWSDMNAYADAKTDVIEAILSRARLTDP